jgi:hypothetical protein
LYLQRLPVVNGWRPAPLAALASKYFENSETTLAKSDDEDDQNNGKNYCQDPTAESYQQQVKNRIHNRDFL